MTRMLCVLMQSRLNCQMAAGQLQMRTCVCSVLVDAQRDPSATHSRASRPGLLQDRVLPSRLPNAWNLNSIFISGAVFGGYLTLSSWVPSFTRSD